MTDDPLADPLESARASLEGWSADQLASLVCTAIGLAALRHPDLLREALSQVFNPRQARATAEAFKRQVRNMRGQQEEIWKHATGLKRQVFDLSREVAALGRQRDALLESIEQIEQRVAKLKPAPANGAPVRAKP